MLVKDIVGNRYGRLTVLSINGRSKCGHTKWLCLCDCGNTVTVDRCNLISGGTVSCGCYRRENYGKHNYKHGCKNDKLYHVWSSMKKRCYNENDESYSLYGGRGITVCEEWLNDYARFKEWAEINGYDKDADYMQCTLDRIDVNGSYSPENCRWVNQQVQCNNKRNNNCIEYNGEEHTISEWARIQNINYYTLWDRLNKKGWSVEKAFTTPVKK